MEMIIICMWIRIYTHFDYDFKADLLLVLDVIIEGHTANKVYNWKDNII